jgi:organic radical activating enzyme
MIRATVRLTLECDNRCIFCSQDGLGPAADADVDAELRSARAVTDSVTFVGGEPALDDQLVEHVRLARALGFRRVGVQTNGGRIAALVEPLALAGVTDVHLSIHGVDAASHDYHTGANGSFDRALSTLAAARAARLDVAVVSVLTRSSFRILAEIAQLLSARGVNAWLLEVARTAGRAADARDRVVPRLALAMPFALHALDVAARAGMPAWIRGAPACLLGPFARRAMADDPRAFGAACESCGARPSCSGVDAEYLARFGGDELTPRAPFDLDPDHAELRAMFVGVGELAVRMAAPTRARVDLPMLGKVKPAVAEASSRGPKRSGEALREILPELFEPKKP